MFQVVGHCHLKPPILSWKVPKESELICCCEANGHRGDPTVTMLHTKVPEDLKVNNKNKFPGIVHNWLSYRTNISNYVHHNIHIIENEYINNRYALVHAVAF